MLKTDSGSRYDVPALLSISYKIPVQVQGFET